MDINIRVPALEKLLEYFASGVGSVAGTVLATWKANRESAAKQIAAKGAAEALNIEASGQADAMALIVQAQSDARAILESPNTNLNWELDLGATITQGIRFQERKRQQNVVSVVTQAASFLGDKEVPDKEPDQDWISRFFGDAQDVSTGEMQWYWAKILAGEIEQPESASVRTLSILKTLDRSTASHFRQLCSACISILRDEHTYFDARVPSLGVHAGNNSLSTYGMSFDVLNVLNEHGLIISEFNSWFDYRICVAVPDETGKLKAEVPFMYQGGKWVFVPLVGRVPKAEFRVSGVALTRSGLELFRVIEPKPIPQFSDDLNRYFESIGMQMVEIRD